jgi:hypothetical protein
MPLADRALPGISRGIRALLMANAGTPGQSSNPMYDQARSEKVQMETEGQDIENEMSSYRNKLATDPNEIVDAAAYAAGVSPEAIKTYQFNRRFNFPVVDKYDATPGGLAEMSGLSPEQAAAANAFMVSRYGGMTNEKGASDFTKGLNQNFQTGMAQAAAGMTENPNAKIAYSQGDPYTPFKVQGNAVVDTGTGDIEGLTEIGEEVVKLTQAKQGTEGARQRNLKSKEGFAPSRAGGGSTDAKGIKLLSELPPQRRYTEAYKMALRENEARLKAGEDPESIPSNDELTRSIIKQAETYDKPVKSKKGTPEYQKAIDYAIGRSGEDITPELRDKGWGDEDIKGIMTRSKNWTKLRDSAKALKGADKAKKQSFFQSALKNGWTDTEVRKAIAEAESR